MSDLSERNESIIAMVRAGKSYRETAAKFGLTADRVGQIVRPVLGRQFEVRRITDDERLRIADMAARGMSRASIAAETGRSWTVVNWVLKRLGMESNNQRDVFGDSARLRAVDMVKAGATYSEAADVCGMTRNAVAGACLRAGVKGLRRVGRRAKNELSPASEAA